MSATEVLKEALAALEFRRNAGNTLVYVRRIDEEDFETLTRVVDDYRELESILMGKFTYGTKQHEVVRDRLRGSLSRVIKELLEEKP